MASSPTSDIAIDASPVIRIYKDGRIERLKGNATVPPGTDPTTKVTSKDAVYSSATSQIVRLYLPDAAAAGKLPVLIYFHGGGLVIESASSPTYHNFLNPLVAQARVLAVSVDYRRAPEHPVPASYEDSWEAVKWVGSHAGGTGPEEWVNRYGDLSRVFFAGDSAGANIAHHMGVRFGIGAEKIPGIHLSGMMVIHPYFWGGKQVGGESPENSRYVERLWRVAHPATTGLDDPWINPVDDPNLEIVGTDRILVCVAENDRLYYRGLYYAEKLKQSRWRGAVEVMEAKDEIHVFHLMNPSCQNAVALLNKLSHFINY